MKIESWEGCKRVLLYMGQLSTMRPDLGKWGIKRDKEVKPPAPCWFNQRKSAGKLAHAENARGP